MYALFHTIDLRPITCVHVIPSIFGPWNNPCATATVFPGLRCECWNLYAGAARWCGGAGPDWIFLRPEIETDPIRLKYPSQHEPPSRQISESATRDPGRRRRRASGLVRRGQSSEAMPTRMPTDGIMPKVIITLGIKQGGGWRKWQQGDRRGRVGKARGNEGGRGDGKGERRKWQWRRK